MPLLTKQAMKLITSTLEKSYFTSAGFDVTFYDEGSDYVNITFLDDNSYYLSIACGPASDISFDLSYSPGTVMARTTLYTSSFDECITSISNWCKTIRKEIIADNPLYPEFEELRNSIKKTIDEKFNNATETFAPDELELLKQEMDELAGKFQDLQKRNKITEEELAEIKQTINTLKRDAQYFKKKTWYRTAGNRISLLMAKIITSETGKELLKEGTLKLLEGPS